MTMARGPTTFKQADVTRAVRGVVAAGVEVMRVEVENGKIVVVAGKPGSAERPEVNVLDQWMANHAGETKGH
jgi:hypothetical protein